MLKYFKLSEFACPCCGESGKMSPDLTSKIDKVRENLGVPLHVNSAYRCVSHNAEVGGKTGSLHVLGKAIDISTANLTAEKKRKLLELGMSSFSGIGIGKTYLHFDLGKAKMWVY